MLQTRNLQNTQDIATKMTSSVPLFSIATRLSVRFSSISNSINGARALSKGTRSGGMYGPTVAMAPKRRRPASGRRNPMFMPLENHGPELVFRFLNRQAQRRLRHTTALGSPSETPVLSQGGVNNPHQDNTIIPLELTEQERQDVVALLKSLNGEGWQQVTAPKTFPK